MLEETTGKCRGISPAPTGVVVREERLASGSESAELQLDSSSSMSTTTTLSSSYSYTGSGSSSSDDVDFLSEITLQSSTSTDESTESAQFRTVVDIPETLTATDSSGSKVTLYKVLIESNSICFHLPSSCVWRSYSDFVWLRRRLVSGCSFTKRMIPDLPSRNLFNFFDKDLVERRKEGLQAFLRKVVNDRYILSDAAVHLYLQSNLRTDEIQAWLDRKVDESVYELIQRGKELVSRGTETSRSKLAPTLMV